MITTSIPCCGGDREGPYDIPLATIYFRQHVFHKKGYRLNQKKNQIPLVFLKLDFAKAYDKVDWKFFFYVMGELSMAKYFVGKLGFHSKKKVVVGLNNAISSPFTI
jgi:hypothetical protein